jgi:hypothetical protein
MEVWGEKMNYEELPYGFTYGSAKIERLASDENRGWVAIGITTPKANIVVYVTKTGKATVQYDDIKPSKPKEKTE